MVHVTPKRNNGGVHIEEADDRRQFVQSGSEVTTPAKYENNDGEAKNKHYKRKIGKIPHKYGKGNKKKLKN